MDCPGGGTISLLDNSGGERAMDMHHTLPTVTVGFGKACRMTAGSPSVTAVAPKVPYGTSFSVPDERGKQAKPHPVFLRFNSHPRLSSMPAWIPSGPAGELMDKGGHLRLYAETRDESQYGFAFIMWPQQAHAVEHHSYAPWSLRVGPDTPGVGAENCIADGSRCLMLDTHAADTKRIIAHFELRGSTAAYPQPPSPTTHLLHLSVSTKKPLDLEHTQGRLVLASGKLALRSIRLPDAIGGANPTWHIIVTPIQSDGKHLLHIAWTRHGGGLPNTKGTTELAQKAAVSLPHYCANDEKGWDCIATDYYPDWE